MEQRGCQDGWMGQLISMESKLDYSKENLVLLIRSFRNWQQESSSTPTRERSLNTSPPRLPSTSKLIDECTSFPILPPHSELKNYLHFQNGLLLSLTIFVVQEIDLYTDNHPLPNRYHETSQ